MNLNLRKITVFICMVFMLLHFSCQTNTNTKPNQDAEKIKKAGFITCKMYSSDFSMGQLSENGRLIMEFKYNAEGYVVEMVRYNMDGSVNHRLPVQPSDSASASSQNPAYAGQTIETATMDSAGQAIQKTVITYNLSGNITERFVVKNNTDTISHNSYKYNEAGLITEDIYWDMELKVPVQVIRYEYSKP